MEKLPINNLGDLKLMSEVELKELASTIRNNIIETVSKTGGHLSSNLGIVDLTIALHKTFNSPKDKIIFDVSHQTYAHKMLTGRIIDETTLRKYTPALPKRKKQGSQGAEPCSSSTWARSHTTARPRAKNNIKTEHLKKAYDPPTKPSIKH